MENAFERRFQDVLRHARRERAWHIIGAPPGSGKSMGINDLVNTADAERRGDGKTILPILAVRAPKGTFKTERALGMTLAFALGQVPNKPWAVLRAWLIGAIARTSVEQIIVDDAHDMTLDQLLFLKEVTDTLEAPPHNRPISLTLISASQGDTLPLREILVARSNEVTWRQFRRRLHRQRPYIIVPGLSRHELPEVLDGYEQLYRDLFPELSIVPFAESIHGWLTHPTFDIDRTHTVIMDNLNKLLLAAMHRAYDESRHDLDPEQLHHEAERMALRPNDVFLATLDPADDASSGYAVASE